MDKNTYTRPTRPLRGKMKIKHEKEMTPMSLMYMLNKTVLVMLLFSLSCPFLSLVLAQCPESRLYGNKGGNNR